MDTLTSEAQITCCSWLNICVQLIRITIKIKISLPISRIPTKHFLSIHTRWQIDNYKTDTIISSGNHRGVPHAQFAWYILSDYNNRNNFIFSLAHQCVVCFFTHAYSIPWFFATLLYVSTERSARRNVSLL